MVLQDAQDLLQSKGSYSIRQEDATGRGRRGVLLNAERTVAAEKPRREGRSYGHASHARREPAIRVSGAVPAWC